MIKQILLTTFALGLAVTVQANEYTFADADFFGGVHTTGGTNPPNGSPNGQLLTFGTASASISGSFDFVSADGTSIFTIGTPYSQPVRGGYSSQLGFLVGEQHVLDGFVTLFLRDAKGDAGEGIQYTSSLGSQTFTNSSFDTQLVISQGITASVQGFIDANGFINYTVTATSGDFILDAAYMQITATPDGGSTVMLLGFALVGAEALRRKLRIA